MTNLQNIIMGLLLTASPAFAKISDGIYKGSAPNSIFQASVWTEKNEFGSRQFMEVRQLQPMIKEFPANYLLLPQALTQGFFEEGDLVLPYSRNQGVHTRLYFVAYKELATKRLLFELADSEGNVVLFEHVSNAAAVHK